MSIEHWHFSGGILYTYNFLRMYWPRTHYQRVQIPQTSMYLIQYRAFILLFRFPTVREKVFPASCIFMKMWFCQSNCPRYLWSVTKESTVVANDGLDYGPLKINFIFWVTCVLGNRLTCAHARKIKIEIYTTLVLTLNFSISQSILEDKLIFGTIISQCFKEK